MSGAGDRIYPEEIGVDRGARTLHITFETGESFVLGAELLRVYSPSAEVQGHSPAEKKTVAGKSGVGITDVEPVGNYAIRILFDDGHHTGIYTWTYLHELGHRQDELMKDYEADLAAKGLGR
ncbi:gamma-butyrobetaine hydroxylase-like domain-containing protein [Caenispirillum salinarum]|uniref:gamma-butyrobetaine hydroxylase-like domain-containing protein n=1 Tax=Caenispirillum salinarum TaxID=859058 RepID=UPI00384C4345